MTSELFIVELEDGTMLDDNGDGGFSCWTTREEAQDALDRASDRNDEPDNMQVIQFVRVNV